MAAMKSFVSVVTSCPPLGCIAFVDFVFHRRLLGILVVHILGIAILACVFEIPPARGSILVVVGMRLNPSLLLPGALFAVDMFCWDILEPHLYLRLSLVSYFLECVVWWLTLFLS